MTTASRIKEIRERVDGATEGPWTNECCRGLCPAGIFSKTADHPVCNVIRGEWGDEHEAIEFEDGTRSGLGDSNSFLKYEKPLRPITAMSAYGKVSDCQAKANGDFIAHSRSDTPFLLSEVDRLRGALEEFGRHDPVCILAYSPQGRPTPSGGYEVMYGDKWFEVRPVDRTPKCTCGFQEAISGEEEKKP